MTNRRSPSGRRRAAHTLGLLMCCAAEMISTPDARAQTPASDALRKRLEALVVSASDSARARSVADSTLADTDPEAPQYSEALYWRGLLAVAPDVARASYLKLFVEHPLSPRAGDALYRLALQDLSSGDRAGAISRLNRQVRDFGGSSTSADAAARLGALLLEQGDVRAGCAALDSALAHMPVERVEQRNQLSYAHRPCDNLPAAGDSVAKPDTGTRAGAPPAPDPKAGGTSKSAGKPATPPKAAPQRRWSVQVAAYQSKEEANRLAAKLKASGHDVRVTSETPYRVRIGRFATRSDAVALVAKLKAGGTASIIVEAERP